MPESQSYTEVRLSSRYSQYNCWILCPTFRLHDITPVCKGVKSSVFLTETRNDSCHILKVRKSFDIKCDVCHHSHHGRDKRGTSEEERPAIVIGKDFSFMWWGWFLSVRDLIVYSRDVKYHSHSQAQSWKHEMSKNENTWAFKHLPRRTFASPFTPKFAIWCHDIILWHQMLSHHRPWRHSRTSCDVMTSLYEAMMRINYRVGLR